jgi:hypothetical protein
VCLCERVIPRFRKSDEAHNLLTRVEFDSLEHTKMIMPRKKHPRVVSLAARFSATFVAILAISVFALALSSPLRAVHAQVNSMATPTIAITPASAPVGVPRRIEISGSALSCGQLTATVTLDSSLVLLTGNLLLRVNALVALPPGAPPLLCDIIVPYNATFSYTPSSTGLINVVPVFTGGVILGGSRIVAGAESNAPRAVFDVTGAWYDPSRNGSGFMFVHNANQTDQASGTYYTYDASGVARWFLISDITWANGGRTLQGNLISTTGIGQCSPVLSACPMLAQASGEPTGSIQVDFEPGPTTSQFPPPPSNWIGKVTIRSSTRETLYSGNIVRIGL